ncbi:gamma-glutamyltransferase [Alcaligenaceae bacterium CGII-47]|nr:gamma-glutamyltransferase [Alcaligenaceae bacterium CGII-47]
MIGWLAMTGGMVAASPGPGVTTTHHEDINPEVASGRLAHPITHARHYMANTANPYATDAAVGILAAGGSAADATIAAQMVLNLVEPQSSGIGGGAFIVSFDAARQQVHSYDGRETAPARARADRFMRNGQALPFGEAVNSGRSVGVPGVLGALALLHAAQGRLAWADLFDPAIELAEQGFEVSPRLHALLDANQALRAQPAAAHYFYDAHGQAWPVGHVLRNPVLADTLRRIAQQGPQAFYQGEIASDIVDAVANHAVPGDLSLVDLQNYRALERPALCAPYRVFVLCGPPPPSSGPLAVMQILGILTHTPIAQAQPVSAQAVHYFSEAGRLAYADRDAYVADPEFVEVPVAGMLAPTYLARRARLIDADHAMGVAQAGEPPGALGPGGAARSPEPPSTTQISIVDKAGNAVSMTSSIEGAFGSKIFVRGFLLNNQLTDFSLMDVDGQGRPAVNRVEPLKRPRSSMSPMLVLRDHRPVMVIGSPGGSAIINFVAQTILAVLDWHLDIQQAVALPHYGSRNRDTELERGTPLEALVAPLQAMGHGVRTVDFPSGLQGIVLTPDGLEGGSDPRREGVAAGG